MSVSGVSSATNPFSNYLQSRYNQQIQDFQGLASAVQSGDLASAQTALTAFQKDIQKNPQGPLATALADPNSQISKDFQALQTALQSNDVAGAQNAFAALAQGLKSIHHHRHHKSDGDSAQSTSNTSSSNSTSSLIGVNLNEEV
jgi:DNA-binding FadR family transcriptional regulator